MSCDLENAINALAPALLTGGNRVSNLKRLSGGASQETWRFTVETADGDVADRILRRAPNGQADARSEAAISLSGEAELIKAVGRAGVPVPPVRHICSEADDLGSAFIMDFVPGETLARRILRDDKYTTARGHLARDCGQSLAAIHATDLATLPALDLSSGADQIEKYEQIYLDLDIPRPVFDLAFQVLKAQTPAPAATVLVHGDFRLGNLMVNEAGLAAVLDWELAHLGDPREDIGWLCVNSWRFGQSDKRAGGFSDLKPLLEAYAAAGGKTYDEDEIDWWELLGSLKWGIMCLIMYDVFRSGADASVERAAIGRRVSETEIDILSLIEKDLAHA